MFENDLRVLLHRPLSLLGAFVPHQMHQVELRFGADSVVFELSDTVGGASLTRSAA